MIIINLDNSKNLEKGIKLLKSKVIKTHLMRSLFERKEYTKKSVKRRNEIKNAIYKEKINKSK
jgi:small subunit ribosomal protein S21